MEQGSEGHSLKKLKLFHMFQTENFDVEWFMHKCLNHMHSTFHCKWTMLR